MIKTPLIERMERSLFMFGKQNHILLHPDDRKEARLLFPDGTYEGREIIYLTERKKVRKLVEPEEE